MTYHFYLFVGKFPKLLNFSDSKEKSYLVELNIFKENAFDGLQKILLDTFSRNSWMVRACKKSRKVAELNFELTANVFRRFFSGSLDFTQHLTFRWAYFDSFSWRVHLGVDCARACSEKPFRASLIRINTIWLCSRGDGTTLLRLTSSVK